MKPKRCKCKMSVWIWVSSTAVHKPVFAHLLMPAQHCRRAARCMQCICYGHCICNNIYICFAIIPGSGMCDASQLPPDTLVLSIIVFMQDGKPVYWQTDMIKHYNSWLRVCSWVSSIAAHTERYCHTHSCICVKGCFKHIPKGCI